MLISMQVCRNIFFIPDFMLIGIVCACHLNSYWQQSPAVTITLLCFTGSLHHSRCNAQLCSLIHHFTVSCLLGTTTHRLHHNCFQVLGLLAILQVLGETPENGRCVVSLIFHLLTAVGLLQCKYYGQVQSCTSRDA